MIFILLVICIIIFEWKTKNYIEAVYDDKKQTYLFHDKIRVRKYHNPGAFLNIMQYQRKLLHLISILFTCLIGIFFMITLFQKGNYILKLGLSLLLGGAFSNTYDRLSRNHVIDYFSFCTPFEKFNRIVFNISDFCILIGTLLVVLKTEHF